MIFLFTMIFSVNVIAQPVVNKLKNDSFPFSDIDFPGPAHVPVDKWIIAKKYIAGEYALSTFTNIADTLIKADSSDVVICDGAKSYKAIFLKGLIPLNEILKNDFDFKVFMLSNDSSFVCVRRDFVYLTKIEWLRFIKGNKSTRYFKFHLNRAVYYFALENTKANKQSSMADFINGSKLTWLYRSRLHVPNVVY